jgi:hypothetical protein
MGRRLEMLKKLRYVRPYDSRVYGVFDARTQQAITNKLQTIDPAVFGRYDLTGQKVVPADAEDPGILSLDLDRETLRAQGLVRQHPDVLERERYDLVFPHLPPGSGTLLDACTMAPAPGVRARARKLGYDYLPIDILPARGVQREDVTALSFADGSIAGILSLDTLEHVEDYQAALREFHRVLAPGGVALVHVPVYFFDRPESAPIAPDTDPWDHVRYFSAHELARELRAAGFTLLRLGLHLDYGAAVAVGGKGS